MTFIDFERFFIIVWIYKVAYIAEIFAAFEESSNIFEISKPVDELHFATFKTRPNYPLTAFASSRIGGSMVVCALCGIGPEGSPVRLPSWHMRPIFPIIQASLT